MNPAYARLWSWLSEAKHAWLAGGVVGIALLIALRPGTPEPVIRLTGLALQLLGIGTVAWGISQTRALFGHPSFTSKARGWLTRFPLRHHPIVRTLSGVASIGVAGKLHAMGTVAHAPDRTIEDRVAAIEKVIDALDERVTETERKLERDVVKITDAIKREEHSRQADDSAIRAKLEATGTGGVHISAIGALWLFIGVALSTASAEIAAALR